MTNQAMYHDGMRQLQDIRETRPLADRLEQVTLRIKFTPEDRAFIGSRSMVFVATADARGSRTVRTRAGCRGSCGCSMTARLHFPTTTATACTDRWGTCW